MKTGRLLFASAAVFALSILAGAANAVTITIGFQQAGVNGGAITPVGPGAVDDVAVATGLYGTFSSNVVTGQSSPPNVFGDVLSSTATNTASSAGTLTVYVTAQNITGPIGSLTFTSSLTQNGLPAGWTVTETTLLSTTNQLFDGTTLSTNLFTSIGTFVGSVGADAGTGPYSVTEVYTIVATGAGTALSTISLSAVPGPIVGAGLPGLGLIMACGSLLALARRRRRVAI